MTPRQFHEIFQIVCDWNYEDEARTDRNETIVIVCGKGFTYTFNGHDFEDYNCQDWIDEIPNDDEILIGCNSNNIITFVPLSEITAIQIKIL